jgi:hypothetical protein
MCKIDQKAPINNSAPVSRMKMEQTSKELPHADINSLIWRTQDQKDDPKATLNRHQSFTPSPLF